MFFFVVGVYLLFAIFFWVYCNYLISLWRCVVVLLFLLIFLLFFVVFCGVCYFLGLGYFCFGGKVFFLYVVVLGWWSL